MAIDALVPPKPNELLNATRLSSDQDCFWLATMWTWLSMGESKLSVGGTTPWWHASKAKIVSVAPAAPNKCPMEPLVLVMAKLAPELLNKSLMAFSSIWSPRGVEVAWQLMCPTCSNRRLPSRRAFLMQLCAPCPSSLGAVTWLASAV